MRILILVAFFIFNFKAPAQHNPYHKVDSIMRSYDEKIKSEKGLHKLTYFIRRNFDADSLRLRAAFIWVTEYIAYDVEAANKEDNAASEIDYALKNKMAICGGYANLMKYFCDAFGIENVIVQGYGRTGKADIFMKQNYLPTNHGWNNVRINGTWRFIDATWSSGFGIESAENVLKSWEKRFDETFYFTPPEKFILNHFPENKNFQRIYNKVDQLSFMRKPLFQPGFIESDFSAVLPDTSFIKTKMGDTIVFRLKTSEALHLFYAFTELPSKSHYESYTGYKGGWVEFRYPVSMIGTYNLYIGYYGRGRKPKSLLGYRLEVK